MERPRAIGTRWMRWPMEMGVGTYFGSHARMSNGMNTLRKPYLFRNRQSAVERSGCISQPFGYFPHTVSDAAQHQYSIVGMFLCPSSKNRVRLH